MRERKRARERARNATSTRHKTTTWRSKKKEGKKLSLSLSLSLALSLDRPPRSDPYSRRVFLSSLPYIFIIFLITHLDRYHFRSVRSFFCYLSLSTSLSLSFSLRSNPRPFSSLLFLHSPLHGIRILHFFHSLSFLVFPSLYTCAWLEFFSISRNCSFIMVNSSCSFLYLSGSRW